MALQKKVSSLKKEVQNMIRKHVVREKSLVMKAEISEEDIRKLVEADSLRKQADLYFNQLKEEICSNLLPGKYVGKAGTISKTNSIRKTINTAKIFEDYSNINPEDYTNQKEYTMITIQNHNA